MIMTDAVTNGTRGIAHVDAISLFVEDLAASKAFYDTAFAADIVYEDSTSVALRFERLIVNLLDARSAPEIVAPGKVAGAGFGSRFQMSVFVDDVDATCALLRSRGVTILAGPADRPWGMRTANFVDPSGHSWEIAERLGAAPESMPAAPNLTTVPTAQETGATAAGEATSEAIVRRLTPGDASAYRALMLDAYEQHPDALTSTAAERAAQPPAWWQARLAVGADANDVVFGAFVDGRLIGAAGLSAETRDKTKHKATLFGMYVPAAFRGRGVGRRLVDAVLDHAGARGTRVVQLTVTEGNDGARGLYERCGFAAFGIEPMAMALGPAWHAKVHMWCDVAVRDASRRPIEENP
jgi:ribosomal protein S18 acetylase RimI-like enzyme/catechol 2,3-dioxygenase-like lactoylglutathione lyase family enzyme